MTRYRLVCSKLLAITLSLAAAHAGVAACSNAASGSRATGDASAADDDAGNAGGVSMDKWLSCPMHPQVLADYSTSCPICGMALQSIAADGGLSAHIREASNEGGVPSWYTCPMHAQVRADFDGKCPICGMKLIGTDAGP